ncbi:hypothetical protein L6452_22543 [Arctium lappa]|uniref:Uncharacterized protein n=1 Tax=Arctium lappa TaxID=4217 RepID=A0ACB9B0F1_ARCLA|nr:hypothetical protein L6452_22543 [Arctium lappa]
MHDLARGLKSRLGPRKSLGSTTQEYARLGPRQEVATKVLPKEWQKDAEMKRLRQMGSLPNMISADKD